MPFFLSKVRIVHVQQNPLKIHILQEELVIFSRFGKRFFSTSLQEIVRGETRIFFVHIFFLCPEKH